MPSVPQTLNSISVALDELKLVNKESIGFIESRLAGVEQKPDKLLELIYKIHVQSDIGATVAGRSTSSTTAMATFSSSAEWATSASAAVATGSGDLDLPGLSGVPSPGVDLPGVSGVPSPGYDLPDVSGVPSPGCDLPDVSGVPSPGFDLPDVSGDPVRLATAAQHGWTPSGRCSVDATLPTTEPVDTAMPVAAVSDEKSSHLELTNKSSSGSVRFSVYLERPNTEVLVGISMRRRSEFFEITAILSEGLIQAWNDAHSEMPILVTDCIVQVNGDEGCDAIDGHLLSSLRLSMLLERAA